MNETDISSTDLMFWQAFYSLAEAEHLFERLREEIEWESKTIWLFGREVMQPRLVAWYGEEGIAYTYSGKKQVAKAWTPTLWEIKQKIEKHTHTFYNSVLLNLYRDGNDSMGWHSDDEPELGQQPKIASLSLGENRKFRLRRKSDRTCVKQMDLTNGSLLLMQGNLQHEWQHELPKTKQPKGERINLTFRLTLSSY